MPKISIQTLISYHQAKVEPKLSFDDLVETMRRQHIQIYDDGSFVADNYKKYVTEVKANNDNSRVCFRSC